MNRDGLRMGKARKKQKSTKRAKKAAAPARRSGAGREAEAGLSDAQRASLLRPPADYDDALNSVAAALEEHRAVKVHGASAAKVRSMAKAANRAWEKEDAYRRATEGKLRALEDKRMLAEDAAWRAALDVWDMAKSVGRRRPEVLEGFKFMERYIGGGGRPRNKPQPAPDEQ